MQLGVKTGMVRSVHNCKSGIDAFKEDFSKIARDNDPNDVLSEWFVKLYLRADFSKSLSKGDRDEWMDKYKKSFEQSVNDSLVEGRTVASHTNHTYISTGSIRDDLHWISKEE